MKLAAAVVLCAGCTEAFGVQEIHTIDCATLVDFDGDCVADDKDNCPVNANPAQEDTDAPADGVGDLCDPHPTLPGDRIALFTAFVDPQESTLWTDLAGDPYWTFMPGVAQHMSLTDSVGTIQHTGSIDGAASVTVEASFTFYGYMDQTSTAPRFGVIADGTPGSYNGQTCYITGYSSNPALYYTGELEDVTGSTTSIQLMKPAGAADMVIRLTREPEMLNCHVIHDAAVNDSIQFVPRNGNTWPAGGPVGIIAREASTDVHYVIVYVSS